MATAISNSKIGNIFFQIWVENLVHEVELLINDANVICKRTNTESSAAIKTYLDIFDHCQQQDLNFSHGGN